MRIKLHLAAAGALLAFAPTLALGAIDPAAKCQAVKLKLSGKYAACRLIEDSKAIKTGTPPDYTTCETRLSEAWAKVEAAYPTECPTLGDLGVVEESLAQCLPASIYTVRVFMTPNEPFAHMNWFLNYAESYGELEGSGMEVSCVSQIPGSVNILFDYDAGRQMDAYFSHASTEFTILTELMRCTFIASGVINTDASDFSVGVEAASNLNGDTVAGPNLDVVVEKIE
jgi:hypothetical protein